MNNLMNEALAMNNSSKIGALHSDPKMPNDFKLNIHL
jgi:hypothetical protein